MLQPLHSVGSSLETVLDQLLEADALGASGHRLHVSLHAVGHCPAPIFDQLSGDGEQGALSPQRSRPTGPTSSAGAWTAGQQLLLRLARAEPIQPWIKLSFFASLPKQL